MIIEIKIFKPEHAFDILDRNVDEENVWLSRFGDFEDFIKIWEKGGPSYTVVIDDRIIFCGGVVDMRWNRGEAWTLLSSLFYKYPKACVKTIKNELGRIIREFSFERVQAIVEPEDNRAIRFIEYLGFEREGLLRKYLPDGKDMLMYARIQ